MVTGWETLASINVESLAGWVLYMDLSDANNGCRELRCAFGLSMVHFYLTVSDAILRWVFVRFCVTVFFLSPSLGLLGWITWLD